MTLLATFVVIEGNVSIQKIKCMETLTAREIEMSSCLRCWARVQ